MTDKKLTQLSTGSAIVDADLFYSAPNAGGQVKQPASAFRTYITGGGGVRRLLSADLNLYVATTGSNSNDGLTVGTPWLTIQYALNYVMANVDPVGQYNVFINLAAGTYNSGGSGLVLAGPIPGTFFSVILTTSGSVTIDANDFATIYAYFATISLQGSGTFTLTNQSSGAVILYADQTSVISTAASTTIAFTASAAADAIHAYATNAGAVALGGPVSITGNFSEHLFAEKTGLIQRAGATTTFLSSPTLSGTAFLVAQYNGTITLFATQTYVNSLTGKKYFVQMNGTIETFAQTLPGSIAGTTATGGQFE